nr:hypothetical protein [Tanacetum cinerariifolium]
MISLTGTSSLAAIQMSAAVESVYLSAAQLSVKPAPAKLIQQSPHPSGSRSADPAPPKRQSAQICPWHEPSGTPSPTPVPQQQKPSGQSPQ